MNLPKERKLLKGSNRDENEDVARKTSSQYSDFLNYTTMIIDTPFSPYQRHSFTWISYFVFRYVQHKIRIVTCVKYNQIITFHFYLNLLSAIIYLCCIITDRNDTLLRKSWWLMGKCIVAPRYLEIWQEILPWCLNHGLVFKLIFFVRDLKKCRRTFLNKADKPSKHIGVSWVKLYFSHDFFKPGLLHHQISCVIRSLLDSNIIS